MEAYQNAATIVADLGQAIDNMRRAAPENKPLTNLEDLFGTPEKVADILLPLLPAMEGWCPYCKHWIDGECKVNPHWDCKNALVKWLKSKPEQEGKR